MLADYLFWSIFIFLIPLVSVVAISAILRKMRISHKRVVALSFLIFGLFIGLWSSWAGKKDIVYATNIPGVEPSERVYNQILIPYWQKTLKPVGYEEIPIIELPPVAPPESPGQGERIDVEAMPIYDFPIKSVAPLYIPFSILSWGLIGLFFQIIYNKYLKLKK